MIFLRRKPDKVVVHRIEFQEKERDLLEQIIAVNGATSIFKSIALMDIKTMYALITIIEALGIYNFKSIPTLGDADELLAAFSSWAENGKARREQEEQRTGAAENRPEWVQKSDNWLYSMFYSVLGVDDETNATST